MTKEDILRMAREAGFETALMKGQILTNFPVANVTKEIEHFAELVRADERDIGFDKAELWIKRINAAVLAEREACAKVCEGHDELKYAIQAIRARGASMKTVIEMAREVGMLIDDEGSSWGSIITTEPDELERFAELVRAPLQERIQDLYRQLNEAERELDSQYKLGMEAEREQCAKVCEDDFGNGALNLAAAIRARGQA